MEVKASAKQIRISANKVRRVLALVRGKNASEALMILKYTPNKPLRRCSRAPLRMLSTTTVSIWTSSSSRPPRLTRERT